MNGPLPLQPPVIQLSNAFQRRIPAAVARLMRLATQSAHALIGIPDYQTYVKHLQAFRRGEPIMSYRDFFRDREKNRYALEKGRGFSGIG